MIVAENCNNEVSLCGHKWNAGSIIKSRNWQTQLYKTEHLVYHEHAIFKGWPHTSTWLNVIKLNYSIKMSILIFKMLFDHY